MLVVGALAASCTGHGDRAGHASRARGPAGAASSGSRDVGPGGAPDLFAGQSPHGHGRVARVAVWGEPDTAAPSLGGAAVRSLVLPQLFVARPDGTWAASLAEPGSDRTAAEGRSATFRLRPGARWSDGTAITVDDLRRSADRRFVAGVDGPGDDGTITVRFTQPLPGWHRLWSGVDSVGAPAAGVWGGPFVVASFTKGLEVVLRPNPTWYGGAASGGAPFLDELHLVLVPDSVTARQLLARGEVDAVMPPAATVRTAQLREVAGVHVLVADRGGWWVGVELRSDGLSRERRQAVLASVDRDRFVAVLLRDEATVLDGLAGPEDGTWAGARFGDMDPLKGQTVDLVGENEEPMTGQLQRSMQLRSRPSGGRLELRNAEADRVERWLAAGQFQAAITINYDGPEPCWACRFGGSGSEGSLARQADTGDAAAVRSLEAALRDQALVYPLWRPRTVVAVRDGLDGVQANGFALGAAWNAWQWWWH